MNTWKRCPSMSVKVSWAPGWGSSRRTMARVPSGQEDRSSRSVISATSAPSRSSMPSAVTAGRHRRLGTASTAGSDGFGQVVADGETHAPVPAGIDETVAEAPGIGPGHDLDLVRVDRQLLQGGVEDLDVVGGGVRPGVAGAELAGQGLPGGVEIDQQGMEPEPPLVGRCRLFLLRVGVDQRPVEVEHVEPRIHARRPGRRPSLRPSPPDGGQHRLVDGAQRAPRRRRRGHVAEQRRLVPQRAQVRDGLPVVGQHHGQIDQDLAPVMAPTALFRPRHHRRQPIRQPGRLGQIAQQPGPCMVHDTPTPGGHPQPGTNPITLHLGSALLGRGPAPSTSAVFLARRAFTRIPSVSPRAY